MDKGRATAWALALAGLIPFVGCAAMVAMGGAQAEAWLGALIAYAAVILSFLGGTRWGASLAGASPDPVTLVLSNLPALVAWAALLPLEMASAARLTLLSAGLALMWLWDRKRPPAWYPALRTTATLGALLSLGLAVVVSA
ncbi:DUF3429 domain-containing protein [Brevundimonas bacteroides]|uniref:DUF3429 domain-containing protein n=1 Tax=Brevundimonas bacteroides TaxID=74311 RepID=UPI00068C0228|nr:DUF3429 domain-containing protein [Brevundimonas bacteroides]